MKSLFFETCINMEVAGVKIEEKNAGCPLHMWSDYVEKLTCVKRAEDIAPVYKALVERINENWYEQKLLGDQKLFISAESHLFKESSIENTPSFQSETSTLTDQQRAPKN